MPRTSTARVNKAPAAPASHHGEVPRPSGALSSPEAGEHIESRIYRTIFDGVMNQRLAPGTKLPENLLCDLFHVNRSVVRKVLQKLAHDYIVQLRPNRGAIIAMPSAEETRQIFEARRGLEAVIVRTATENATTRDLAELRRHLKQEHSAMHRVEQPAWARLASSFHLRLAGLARNAILERYLVELVSRSSLIVALHEPPGKASCEHEEHERIVECIERKDADEAVRLMVGHLRELERNVLVRGEKEDSSLGRLLGLL
ncbi:GntR family transcriptional regulator [Variovorax ginsengisoli]|uniref:GntR family transcriptional regulator n=1 Tax=Variovorax ginsengisoli TaxID=363844 RepID=A0ABT8SHU4_9BURK|nr:GntR family transcriptional regulator [Variovorax ginsengisoli]MDN8618597.1 GntR family transcriptional regulator [Variovorax ginsengisoli]MDO1537767.1 GntR family transcriptional regulator [Variovorax ginsengisoli]